MRRVAIGRWRADGTRNHIRLLGLPADQQLAALKTSLQSTSAQERLWAAKELSRRSDAATLKLLNDVVRSGQAGAADARVVLDDK